MRIQTLGAPLLLLVNATFGALISCADDVPKTCENLGTCPPKGGAAGDSGGGTTSGSGAASGKAGTSAGGSTGGSGQAGGAGESDAGSETGGQGGGAGSATAPCGGSCPTDKPICDESSDTCVECLIERDCAGPSNTQCDTTTNTCVECLMPAHCSTAAAARCEAGACVECEDNDDCAHIAGKGVCDGGSCVQCTGTDYAACGMDAGTPLVCDSLLRSCTTNKEGSAGLCKPCVSDAQCTAGKLCVQESFGAPAADIGYFCFWKKGDTGNGAPALCSAGRPYVDTLVNQTSIDGTSGDICGLAVSTCQARNEFRSKDCTTSNAPDDEKCGFAHGEDSKCGQFDAGVYRCTMTCGSDDDCPAGFACDTGANPPVCEL